MVGGARGHYNGFVKTTDLVVAARGSGVVGAVWGRAGLGGVGCGRRVPPAVFIGTTRICGMNGFGWRGGGLVVTTLVVCVGGRATEVATTGGAGMCGCDPE